MIKQQGRCGSAAVRTRLARIIAGASLIIAASPLAPAHAGVYSVYSCKNPDGTPAPTDGWSAAGGGYVFSNPTNSCSQGGSLTAALSGDHDQQVGANMSWTYAAPSGTELTSFQAHRSIKTVGASAINQNAGAIISWPGPSTTDAHENCFANWGCPSMGTEDPWNASGNTFNSGADLNNPARVYFSALCGGNPGYSCPARSAGPMASISVHRFRADLTDSLAPEIGGVSGTLIGSGTKSGVKTLSVRASDVGGGVYRAVIEVKKPGDASFTAVKALVIDGNDGKCAPAPGADSAYQFNRAVPCKLSTSGDVDFDTNLLPDGEQELRIGVEDASGNRVTAYGPETLTVHNAPTSTQAPSVTTPTVIRTGDELTCQPGSFTPAPDTIAYAWLVDGAVVDGATGTRYTVRAGDVGKSIVCRVTATTNGKSTTVDSPPVGGPNQPGGPSTSASPATTTSSVTGSNGANGAGSATASAGLQNPAGANGSGGLVTTARFTAASKKTRRVRYGRKATLTGQLRDAEGRAISGATVDVYSRVARKGSVLRKVGTVVTDRDGVYRWVAPIGLSRQIRFAYRAVVGAADYRDQVDVALQVGAKLTLKARRARVKSFGKMQLRGKLYGKGLPSRGALVEIQYLDGGTWKTAAVRRTKRGVIRFDYRYKRTAKGVFAFRALLRRQTGIPLTKGTSRKVVVRVG